MDQNEDFSSLRSLLALKKLDMPQDTQVEEFLTEFHRRQRAQLLISQSVWSKSFDWVKEKMAGLQLVPSLSYASALAAIVILACLGLSQQVQVTDVGGQSSLSFRMPSSDTSFAMVPGSFAPSAAVAPRIGDSSSFTPTRSDSAATRFVLATNSQGAHDATVAF